MQYRQGCVVQVVRSGAESLENRCLWRSDALVSQHLSFHKSVHRLKEDAASETEQINAGFSW